LDLPSFDFAFLPAWFDDLGCLPQVYSLKKVVHNANKEGLRPEDYHLNQIEEMHHQLLKEFKAKGLFDPQQVADLDLLLTDTFLIYAFHLLEGRVNPETFQTKWHPKCHKRDIIHVLQMALDTGQIEESLESLVPKYPAYERLRTTLMLYRDISTGGGWPHFPNGDDIQKGMHPNQLIPLINRLIISGDIDQNPYVISDLLDDKLDQGIRRFQQRHGLMIDGTIGPDTLRALNIPSKERVRQIELNLERWRWLPRDLGHRFIVVNIADFKARLFENNQSIMEMKVVVGKDYRQTPVFSGRMTYLVLSPYWYIPRKLAVEDKLPLIHQDPNYLIRQHITVFQVHKGRIEKVDPKMVDWSAVNADNFQYKLCQEPGPWNPLGRIKFMFPNKYAVYLHDTSSQDLFEEMSRTFSSGCIRIEKPIELATYLLKEDPNWTREKIIEQIQRNVETTIRIPEPIPVHVLYWTAWTNEDSTVEFRQDIYGRDMLLEQALHESIPAP